jgi:dihydropteroate synthase
MKMVPDTIKMFQQSPVFNCGGQILSFSSPKVMGILNVTPDSFYDGGKFTDIGSIVKRAGKMIRDGAAVIDVGAQSTRPGARMVSSRTEVSRLIPAIKAILDKYPGTIISADTFRSDVASKAADAGATIINDVSGGNLDPEMFDTVARLHIPYILMHMQGIPATMQKNPQYADVTESVFSFFASTIRKLEKAGVVDIIIDPGFGFGKTVQHNYRLLQQLPVLCKIDRPVLVGVSNKSMICRVLQILPKQALNGTTALNMAALLGGASMLRVHHVKEAVEVIKLYSALKNQSGH